MMGDNEGKTFQNSKLKNHVKLCKAFITKKDSYYSDRGWCNVSRNL